MNLVYKCLGKNLIVKFLNDIDDHETRALRVEIDEIIDTNNIINIVFDFANIEFMDSSGIGLIMGRYNKIEEKGGKIYIVNIKNTLNEILRISGIYNIVLKYDTIAEAMDMLV